jgi:thiol-disulfide isomerase/thioredoxin
MAVSAFASGEIGPGSTAPKIEVKTWLKGTPVKDFAADKLYVVEFWATWCGPCLQSIPHVTEMAKKNPDVTFVGVSIWEDEEGDKLPKFVANMGDKMGYNVGYSGNQDGMAQTWMAAAGQNGIPCAFIIKDQKVAWIGHPMEMDEPLSKIKAGTFDSAAFKKSYDEEAAKGREAAAANAAMSDAVKLYDDGKKAEAKTALEAAVAKYPQMAEASERIKYSWLANDDVPAFDKATNEMLATKDPAKLQLVASYALANAKKPEKLALVKRLADQVLAANEKDDYLTLNYVRNIYVRTNENKKALTVTNKMIELFPTSEAKDSPDFLESLKKSKAELEAKVSA